MGTLLDAKITEVHNKRIMDEECKEVIKSVVEEVMKDTMQVFKFGAKKHPDTGSTPNFLTPAGNKCSHKDRASSCLRHSAEVFAGRTEDEESSLHPALHLISSAVIFYIRQKRSIKHPDD